MTFSNRHDSAHDTVMDVMEEQIARVYALAFMGVTAKGANPGGLVEELTSIVEEVLDKHPQLEEMLHSSLVSHEQKEQLLDRVLKGRVSTEVINFLKVLSRHGRLRLIRSAARQAKQLHAKRSGLTDVEVRVARELDASLYAEIETHLRKMLDSTPILSVVVDQSLIAGIVIRVGDRVYDGSVSNQLERTRQAMIDRATEHIELRPERFLTSKN